ncbi:MAG: hypothetical protein K8T25_03710 [Planctomycetia bacterium]|nr:hypothetical protein [Planctomycetia bacterium]
MIVPQFWAEGRFRHRDEQRQVTFRRFGWSDISQEDAQLQADARAREAFDRFVAGVKVNRRERKVPYNGAEGLPIREEIIERYGDTVITRNSYGARCLNTPDVLFADVDLDSGPTWPVLLFVYGGSLAAAGAVWWWLHSMVLAIVAGLLALVVTWIVAAIRAVEIPGDPEKLEAETQRRIVAFVDRHREWHVRVYRTPAGMRALVMHRTFDPNESAVAEFFAALKSDPIYVLMCQRQHCFRARVSPKPWRIGIAAHIKPRPGTWPVKPERLPARSAWIEAYEKAARDFAACEFIEAVGGATIHPKAEAVRRVHDDLCKAESNFPIA